MNKESKPWGASVRAYLDEHSQVEWIYVLPTGYSSVHLHRRKTNLFLVHEGMLEVRVFDEQCAQVGVMTLYEGMQHVIHPRTRHQFHTRTGASATEIYWCASGKLDVDDIVRFSENGRSLGKDADWRQAMRGPYCSCSVCNSLLEMESKTWEPRVFEGAVRPVCGACLEAWKKS